MYLKMNITQNPTLLSFRTRAFAPSFGAPEERNPFANRNPESKGIPPRAAPLQTALGALVEMTDLI